MHHSTKLIVSNYGTRPHPADRKRDPVTATARPEPTTRSPWRAVAIPNEHGGWGLTLEPALLGLLIAPSLGGASLGFAAVLAFLLRTPLKLVSIDLRHHRWIDRSRLAARVAVAELFVITMLGVITVVIAGWAWMVPIAVAAPLVAVEWSYDSRGRGRRLVPELAGAVGIAAVAAAVVIAGGGSNGLAAGAWLVLAARSAGSIPFVRVQVGRLRRGRGSARASDAWQAVAVLVGLVAAIVEPRMLVGTVAVGLLAMLQIWWVRRPPVPAKQLGLTQLGLGIALVVATAIGAAV
jgi:hypothetical protein